MIQILKLAVALCVAIGGLVASGASAQDAPDYCSPGPDAEPAEIYLAARICGIDANDGFVGAWTTEGRPTRLDLAIDQADPPLTVYWIPRRQADAAFSRIEAWRDAEVEFEVTGGEIARSDSDIVVAAKTWLAPRATRDLARAAAIEAGVDLPQEDEVAAADIAALREQIAAWREEAEDEVVGGQPNARSKELTNRAALAEAYLAAQENVPTDLPGDHPRRILASLAPHVVTADIVSDALTDSTRILTVLAPQVTFDRVLRLRAISKRYDLLVAGTTALDGDSRITYQTFATTRVVSKWLLAITLGAYAIVVLYICLRSMGSDKSALAGANGRMSLGHAQIAFFTIVVMGMLTVHFTRTGLLGDLSQTVLTLLGVLAVGTAGGKITDHFLTRISLDNWVWLKRMGWVDEKYQKRQYSWRQLFTDASGQLDIFRIQAAAISVIVALYMIAIGPAGLADFDIPENIVVLLGLSQGTYVVGKAIGPPKWKELDAATTEYRDKINAGVSPSDADMQEKRRNLAGSFEACFGYPPDKRPRPGHIGLELTFDGVPADRFPLAISYRGRELARLNDPVDTFSNLDLPHEAEGGEVIVRQVQTDGMESSRFLVDRVDAEVAEQGLRMVAAHDGNFTNSLPHIAELDGSVGLGFEFAGNTSDRFPLELYLDGARFVRLEKWVPRVDYWQLPHTNDARLVEARDKSGDLHEIAKYQPGDLKKRKVSIIRLDDAAFANPPKRPEAGHVGLDLAVDPDLSPQFPITVKLDGFSRSIARPTERVHILDIPYKQGERTITFLDRNGETFTEDREFSERDTLALTVNADRFA